MDSCLLEVVLQFQISSSRVSFVEMDLYMGCANTMQAYTVSQIDLLPYAGQARSQHLQDCQSVAGAIYHDQ